MKIKPPAQGVRITAHRPSINEHGQVIVRLELSREARRQLNDVLDRADASGLGINKRGEYQLFLTNYNGHKPTANGRLGIVRTGKRDLDKKIARLEQQLADARQSLIGGDGAPLA